MGLAGVGSGGRCAAVIDVFLNPLRLHPVVSYFAHQIGVVGDQIPVVVFLFIQGNRECGWRFMYPFGPPAAA